MRGAYHGRLPESAEDLASDYDRQDIMAVDPERAI